MNTVQRNEIVDYQTYDERRDQIRRETMGVKEARRLHLGKYLTISSARSKPTPSCLAARASSAVRCSSRSTTRPSGNPCSENGWSFPSIST